MAIITISNFQIFFSTYLLLQNYRAGLTLAGLGVEWTLVIEVSFYIALPFIAWFLRSIDRPGASRAHEAAHAAARAAGALRHRDGRAHLAAVGAQRQARTRWGVVPDRAGGPVAPRLPRLVRARHAARGRQRVARPRRADPDARPRARAVPGGVVAAVGHVLLGRAAAEHAGEHLHAGRRACRTSASRSSTGSSRSS